MPRTSIPVQTLAPHGGVDDDLSWTAADATNDHEFQNTGRELLFMKNDDASQHTADVKSVACSHNRMKDPQLAPAASKIAVAGPFPPGEFNQRGASDLGKVFMDLTDGTSVSFAVVRFAI